MCVLHALAAPAAAPQVLPVGARADHPLAVQALPPGSHTAPWRVNQMLRSDNSMG